LRPRNKNFLEDTVIFIIVGALIYGIYTFFFSAQENTQIVQNPTVVEKTIDLVQEEEKVQKEISQSENIKETETAEDKNIAIQDIKEGIKEQTSTKEKTEEIEIKSPEIIENETIQSNSNITIESFYKSIEDKIYLNITKNVDKNTLNSSNPVNIRITILQDGRYEQLTYMSGNKQYFDKIKSSIVDVFPVNIPTNLKSNFPRYFRMEVEY
jgi:hypothetical protein